MIVERIAVTTDWVMDALRIKHYKTLVDNQGKTYVGYEQYLFVPYTHKGTEAKDATKGQTIDLRA